MADWIAAGARISAALERELDQKEIVIRVTRIERI